MKRWVFSLLLLLPILSCTTKNKELDDLALAQSCLDNVPETDPQQANSCMQFTDGYTDSRANEMKCSIMLTAGGITIDRMAEAYAVTQNGGSSHGQADYIAYLALNLPSVSEGYTNSQIAQGYCDDSGDPGLAFIGNLAVVGSMVNNLAGPTGIDLTGSAASVDSAVQTALANCEVTPLPAECDSSVVGPAAAAAANDYCSNSSNNQSVCSTLTSTISQYGSDPATETAALMCTLQGKTFNNTVSPPTCS